MKWRIERCWSDHVGMRAIHWEWVEYRKPPGGPPALTHLRKKIITEALRNHDAHQLTEELRDQWVETSKVRAAGVGIFLDKFLTAEKEGNKLGEGGSRYLEPERAWKIMRGKPDPVDRFADLYFERKAREAGKANG